MEPTIKGLKERATAIVTDNNGNLRNDAHGRHCSYSATGALHHITITITIIIIIISFIINTMSSMLAPSLL